MMERFHAFTSGQSKIAAVWHESSRHDAPIVIFHHGFGGTKVESHRMFVKCARQLAEKGFDSFRFDFFGSGDSDGSLTDATLSQWIQNSRDAVSYVKSKGKKKICLLGFSMGGFVAAAAAGKPAHPFALILWAPIFHPLKRILREKKLITQARATGTADYGGELVGVTLVEDAARFKIPEIFQGYANPVCILHGSQDESAPPAEAKQFAKFYRKENASVHLHAILGANHHFERHDWEAELLGQTLHWLEPR